MKDFNDYKIADITNKEQSEITTLEDRIKSDCGKDVVLIAYESKSDHCSTANI